MGFREWPRWTGQILVSAVSRNLAAARWGAAVGHGGSDLGAWGCLPRAQGLRVRLWWSSAEPLGLRASSCLHAGAQDTAQPGPLGNSQSPPPTQTHERHATEQEWHSTGLNVGCGPRTSLSVEGISWPTVSTAPMSQTPGPHRASSVTTHETLHRLTTSHMKQGQPPRSLTLQPPRDGSF